MNEPSLDTIVRELRGTRAGDNWNCRCPAHYDQHASLSVGQPNGKILLKCHAGCDQDAVIAALRARGLWPEPKPRSQKEIAATYAYTDARGKLLHEVVRFKPKDFRQRRLDGIGGWIWNLQGVEHVPFRLPEVLKAIEDDQPIVIVEGEKDVESLRQHGITATCNSGGACKWTSAHSKWLKGATVYVIPDNDAPGRDHAKQVAGTLRGIAKHVSIVELPNLPAKGDVSDWLAAGGTREALQAIFDRPCGESPEGQIRGAKLLDKLFNFLARFVAYPSVHALIAHVLWIVHTHLMEEWESTPRIGFLSPEPGSGKTRALELTETLVPRPVEAINTTPAYLFRKVSDPDGPPTILYDEIDTLFGPRAKDNEEIRGMLNAGHRRGAMAGRCVVRGKVVETEELPAYCAVALAGLGNLPDTILTRSVVIRMRRRAPTERVEPYRRRLHAPDGNRLRDQLSVWAEQLRGSFAEWPDMPPGIVDRDADVWEALLAVADAAGGDWPTKARVAAVALVADAKAATPSLGVRLLSDLKHVFGDRDVMATDEIIKGLCGLDEAPWVDLKGKPIDPKRLANYLRPYGVASKNIRIGNVISKGYTREDLHDPWIRYLGLGEAAYDSATSATSATNDAAEPPWRADACAT